jgi:hypothetical protein
MDRLKNKLYLVDFNKGKVNLETCLVAKSSMGWLWHRRLAHVGMRNLAKLQKDEHILGLTKFTLKKIGYVTLVKPESKLVYLTHQRAS